MEKIIVTVTGFFSIIGIYWFFFGKKSGEAGSGPAREDWRIVVDGGYKPNVIKIPKDKTGTITITRKDPGSCFECIIFPDYKIKEYLPLNKEVIINLPPPHKKSVFHCGMNMFHGRIEAK
jgi:plastocyanin domain-containing protein